MDLTKTKQIVIGALFMSMGILLPFFTAHMFGIPGTVLLPMHIPIFMAGLFAGPKVGVAVGLITPVLSSILTGMPQAFPMLPIMVGELATYGLVSGFIFKMTKKIYASMLGGMIAGRLVYGLIFKLLVLTSATPIQILTVPAALITGLPGISIQLILIPIIVKSVMVNQKSNLPSKRYQGKILAEAKRQIKGREHSCVIIQNNSIEYQGSGRGVKPIMYLYEERRDLLAGAFVVDRIIGKAAAMLLVDSDVAYVYGEIMSKAGEEYLTKHGVTVEYERCVEVISNRTGTGLCPLEKSVLDLEEPSDAYEKLKESIAVLMKAG